MSYRLEYAKRGTSKCKGRKPCSGTPIDKGGLRLGTVVDMQGHSTFAWRHYGCITEKQFENMKKDFESADQVDGFEDLNEEDQAKFTKAFDEGHVDDADIPDSARKPVKAEGEDEDEELKEKKGGSSKPKKAAPKKKAAKKKDDDDDNAGDDAPKEKKKKAPVKKAAAKSKKAKKEEEEGSAEETDEDKDVEPKKAPAKRGRKPKEGSDADSDHDAAPVPPRKPSSRGTASKKSMKEDSDEQGSDDEAKPVAKKLKKAKKEEVESD